MKKIFLNCLILSVSQVMFSQITWAEPNHASRGSMHRSLAFKSNQMISMPTKAALLVGEDPFEERIKVITERFKSTYTPETMASMSEDQKESVAQKYFGEIYQVLPTDMGNYAAANAATHFIARFIIQRNGIQAVKAANWGLDAVAKALNSKEGNLTDKELNELREIQKGIVAFLESGSIEAEEAILAAGQDSTSLAYRLPGTDDNYLVMGQKFTVLISKDANGKIVIRYLDQNDLNEVSDILNETTNNGIKSQDFRALPQTNDSTN